MKVAIRDAQAVSAISPVDAASYLISKGWVRQDKPVNKASVWVFDRGEDQFEILLPTDKGLMDYALRMADLLGVLSAVEARSGWQIYNDLLTVNSDVIRIHIDDPGLADGSILMEDHVQIAQNTRDLVLAAACATTEKRPVWYKRKPAQVMDNLRRFRIGQSERGSYVVTVISRVGPHLHDRDNPLAEMEDPFERQVTQTLAQSLRALDAAAESAAMTQEMAAFYQAVQDGVNANLCDAVAGFWGDNDLNRRLDFTFSWSPSRPVAPDFVQSVALSFDRIPLIREAGKLMREREPLPEFELRGPVVRLERPENAPTGRVTIVGLVEDRQAHVSVELDEEEYHKAINAHDSGSMIRIMGVLTKEGRGYALKNPSPLIVEAG